jgi:hypothetical protein
MSVNEKLNDSENTVMVLFIALYYQPPNPPTPQGGLSKYLFINKSFLGDLGVADQKRAFMTASARSLP